MFFARRSAQGLLFSQRKPSDQAMHPTQHFVAATGHMRIFIFKVLGG
jgi:hypothetical protein